MYTRTNKIELPFVRDVSGKRMILWKRRLKIVLCDRITIFGSTLKYIFILDVEDNH